MRLDPDSWHVKWYFLATTLFAAWKSVRSPSFVMPINTNVCPYMRRLLVTFPLLLLFYTAVIWWVANAILIYPITHFGWIYYEVVGAATGLIMLLIAIIVMLCKICPSIVRFVNQYITDRIIDSWERMFAVTVNCVFGHPESPTFCAVMRQWIVDRHHQICRPLVIGDGEQE